MDTNAIVIDNGTGLTKSGFSGDDAPRSIFPTIVGKPKMPGILVGLDQKDVYIGEEVKEKKGVVKLDYPIERGIIKDWEGMEKIWNYIICQELKSSSEEQGMLLTEPPLNPKDNREKIVRIMFETYNVPLLYLGVQTIFSMYASGKTTGLIIDIGEGVTNVAPINEGLAIPYSNTNFPIAGKDLTLHLQNCLRKRGYNLPASDEFELVQWLKERLCQVAPNYGTILKEAEESTALEMNQVLPDGNKVITIGLERYQTPEILFDPKIVDKELQGVQHQAANSILKCEPDLKPELCKNVILSGGSTMIPYIGNRIKIELEKILSPKEDIEILEIGRAHV